MLEVKEVKTKKEQKQFLDFPLKLYKGNKCFVPPLYADERQIFKKNYVYYETSEAVYYNAYKDGVMVGRISGILQKASNEKWKQNRVRFTRFDSIDDQEVANALFNAVEKWAKEKGMNEVVGPLGFSDLEREGLLIEGFDEIATFEEQYNFAYYQKLIENLGYEKEIDWVERKVYLPDEEDHRLEKLIPYIMKKYNLSFAQYKSINECIKKYGEKLFAIIDETYEHIYGSVPFTDGMRKMLISNFKTILRKEDVIMIVDEDDRVVCFGLAIPAIGEALQKSSGHLTLPTIIKILKAKNNPKVLDLALIGVIPEYEMRGVSSILIKYVMDKLKEGLEHMETNLNLETNYHIQNQWKSFKTVLHKRRRAYIKKI